jgi:hypothetical protein
MQMRRATGTLSHKQGDDMPDASRIRAVLDEVLDELQLEPHEDREALRQRAHAVLGGHDVSGSLTAAQAEEAAVAGDLMMRATMVLCRPQPCVRARSRGKIKKAAAKKTRIGPILSHQYSLPKISSAPIMLPMPRTMKPIKKSADLGPSATRGRV